MWPDWQRSRLRKQRPRRSCSLTTPRPFIKVPSKKLIGGEKHYVKAVDDVSLTVKKGETLGIVGESGCGKSTLVKTIIGMEAPTGGELEFMGVDISDKVITAGSVHHPGTADGVPEP